jgi:hypothetical protein
MPQISRLVLDVLKPLEPDITHLADQIARTHKGSSVHISVKEIDASTESVVVDIKGESLNLEELRACLNTLGVSLHSIDEVEVMHGDNEAEG